MEWLFTPLMLSQNYHLVHRLHPSVPFYRYLRTWRRNEEAYLERDAAIATVFGAQLNPEEFREWKELNYSICSPATDPQLRIAVKHIPGGAFSTFAREQLKAGDVLELMTPTGRFGTPLDPLHEKHYVAIAVGSGITPILSIAATTLEIETESRFTLI
jgi:hypothetical protein